MRDIIKRINNGRRYDLDTALEIAVVTHGLPGAYSFDVERLLTYSSINVIKLIPKLSNKY